MLPLSASTPGGYEPTWLGWEAGPGVAAARCLRTQAGAGVRAVIPSDALSRAKGEEKESGRSRQGIPLRLAARRRRRIAPPA